MKKTIIVLTLLISSFNYAQQEFKIDIANPLIIKSLGFSYENYLSEESTIGISTLFNLAKQDVSFRYNENVMITPYYRHYFSSVGSMNFFGEGFIGISSGKTEIPKVGNNEFSYEKYTAGALGLAFGAKYVSNGNFILDAYAGLGRNLFGPTLSPTIVPRIGVNIGWRL